MARYVYQPPPPEWTGLKQLSRLLLTLLTTITIVQTVLIRHPGGYVGEDIDYLYDYVHSGLVDEITATVDDKEILGNFDRVTGDYNDFWAGRLHSRPGARKGRGPDGTRLNDWNVVPEHSVRIYDALKGKGIPLQAFFHQGGHIGPPPMKQMNRWFRVIYMVLRMVWRTILSHG